ncbi:LOB domain-containing protein 33-like [Solanum stenotomum]|uniref:LOB domain-containing protein 33-like n=1 Tax=Solanum stenotomum TaxID=172797 RepID=UPI0020D0A45D|nr:LOB domain-containing protein 33-like [Solanum stenotomum]
MTGPGGSSCGACKFLRRKCSTECIFAPYFSYEEASKDFSAVHKVFGASKVSKLLLHLPLHCRSDAALTMSYEALARMHDPIYERVGHIFALHHQIASLIEEIEIMENQMASFQGEVPMHNMNINTLQYSLECNNMNLENNHVNHSITSPSSANEAFAMHMISRFSIPFFDLDILERFFEGQAPPHQSAFAILGDMHPF